MKKDNEEILDELRNKYNFEEEIIVEIYKYCKSKKSLSRDYMLSVASSWKSNNINTLKDLEEYIRKSEEIDKIGSKISKIIERQLSQYEEELLFKWIYKYNIDENQILSSIRNKEKTLNIFNEVENELIWKL